MKKGGVGLATFLVAVSPGGASIAQALPMADAQQIAAATKDRPRLNPYGRDINITAPLQFNNRILGEVAVLLTQDDRFLVDSQDFLRFVKPLLTPEAEAALARTLEGRPTFEAGVLADAGIWLEYDPDQLALLVIKIDPANRVMESLYETGRAEAPADAPEPFSAYLNSNMVMSYRHADGDAPAPSLFLEGAARFGSVVFEADVQGSEDLFDGKYRVLRRYARMVYDQPEDFRRWYLGDLTPETRGRQGFVEMGGVGVSRQRLRFDTFRNNVLTGGRQLLLQEAATIRVLRNGVFQREFRLDPGQYDISGLPLDTGSNDVRLEIQSESGRVESLAYRAYVDAIDLEPGDYEYGAYLGVTSATSFGGRDYEDGRLAFSGFWRKAFVNMPAIGLGMQLSEDIQTMSGQSQVILRNGARLGVDGSLSNSPDGSGYAYALSYDYAADGGDSYSSWNFVADYTSEDYATIGGFFANPTSWTFSGSYSRRLSENWYGNLNASYRVSRSDVLDDAYSIGLSSTYRVNPQWSVRMGAEAADYGNLLGDRRSRGVGVTFALIWQPRYDRRGEAQYSSASNMGSVRYQQMSSGQAGSVGYSLASTYNDGPGSLSGQIDYVGNRFDASLSHAAYGRSFSNVTDDQISTLRIGSSIATAGGRVGIGRHIGDSFALVYPHASLGDRDVIAGDSLQDGRRTAVSGPLGAAVFNRLSAYANQSVRYDVIAPPIGYNIGEGVRRVHPAYRSGYAIEVGGAKFVSAVGRLTGRGDKPAALMSGRLRALDDAEAGPELFFTNSAGRFAVQNLEPGKRYRVELFSDPAAEFEFTVPADNEGLLDLRVVSVPIDVPED